MVRGGLSSRRGARGGGDTAARANTALSRYTPRNQHRLPVRASRVSAHSRLPIRRGRGGFITSRVRRGGLSSTRGARGRTVRGVFVGRGARGGWRTMTTASSGVARRPAGTRGGYGRGQLRQTRGGLRAMRGGPGARGGRGRGGPSRGARGGAPRGGRGATWQPSVTHENLDAELEKYMGEDSVRARLDSQLEAYSSRAPGPAAAADIAASTASPGANNPVTPTKANAQPDTAADATMQ
eukprot:GHVT01013635.1.p1 GENE.GHVT01013635.1~~GHVT01013635.1.p1  ORF type:complete len:239 (+),score=52.16 GHVT01013635.1:149-865(+)